MNSLVGAFLSVVLACSVFAQESAGPTGPSLVGATKDAYVRELANAGKGNSQDPKSIEGMIAAALRSNPDVLVAEAKVREAEAELNRVRMKVTQDVMALQNRREAATITLRSAEMTVQRKSQMHKSGTIDAGAFEEAQFELLRARHAFATVETESKYLLGEGSAKPARTAESRSIGESPSNGVFVQRPPLTTSDSVFLSQPIAVSAEEARLTDVFAPLKAVAAELGTMIVIDEAISEITLSVEMKETTVEKFLTLLTDRLTNSIAFVFRPYGVFVTTPQNAQRLWGAAVPAELPVMRAAEPPINR